MLLPTYNEDPHRLTARLRAIIESLEATNHGELFDWYVLSDSTDPDIWVAEEKALLALRQAVGTPRLYYRHRADNTARKAGNGAIVEIFYQLQSGQVSDEAFIRTAFCRIINGAGR